MTEIDSLLRRMDALLEPLERAGDARRHSRLRGAAAGRYCLKTASDR
ncbi:MAG TPA: hypothetical protein VK131_10855 [Candidatus Acidoferrales bacterium]|nr:hypothetical protein [Candidatus Acidoferrales bacterium]